MSRTVGNCFIGQESVILSNDFDTILQDFLRYVEGHSKPNEKNEWMNSNTDEQWEEVCNVYEQHGLVSGKKDLIGDQRQEKLTDEDIDPNDAVVIHTGKLDIASVASRADRPSKRDKKKSKHRKNRQASSDSQDKEPDSPFVLEEYIGPKNRRIFVIKKNSPSEEGNCTDDNLKMKELKSDLPVPSNGSPAKQRYKEVALGFPDCSKSTKLAAEAKKTICVKSEDHVNEGSNYRKVIPKFESKSEVESSKKKSKDSLIRTASNGKKETSVTKKRKILSPPSTSCDSGTLDKRKGQVSSSLKRFEEPSNCGSCILPSFQSICPSRESLAESCMPAQDKNSQSSFYYKTDYVFEDELSRELSAYQMNNYLMESGYENYSQADVDSASFSVSILPTLPNLPNMEEHQQFQRKTEYHHMLSEKLPVVILQKIPL